MTRAKHVRMQSKVEGHVKYKQNYKFETVNSKQIQMTKKPKSVECQVTSDQRFPLDTRRSTLLPWDFDIRISDLVSLSSWRDKLCDVVLTSI
jgi:hypothetical protein